MDGFIIEGDVLKKYTGDGGRVVIPDGINVIGEEAFWGCNVTEVIFPHGLRRIGNQAFYQCTALTEIVIPDTVVEVGRWAFAFCSSLEQAEVGGCGDSLSDGVFKNCGKLKIVQLPEGLCEIGENAFGGCEALEYIYFPDSLEDIDEFAFYGCVSLKEVEIPLGVNRLSGAHFGFGAVTEFRVAEGNRHFKAIDGSLYDKSGDTLIRYACGKTDNEFYVPYHVKNIDEFAFAQAINLKRVFLHDGVKRIGRKAFYGSGITEIEIPRSIEYLPELVFGSCKALRSVKLSDTLIRIGEDAFYLCESLLNIVIPEQLKTLENGAFSYCSGLTSLLIPKGVERIGDYVFRECNNLRDLTILTDKVDGRLFLGCSSLESIYVLSRELAEKILFDWHYFCAMRGFLARYYERKTTAEEADGWVAYILNHKLKCVEKLGEEMLFWRFMLEREILSAEDVRTYVNLVTALECRAFLFKYLNECGEEDRDGGV